MSKILFVFSTAKEFQKGLKSANIMTGDIFNLNRVLFIKNKVYCVVKSDNSYFVADPTDTKRPI